MCLYPTLIRNPKYKKTKKNGGLIPPISDNRVLYVPVGCQKCMECKKQKARQWQVRLLEDIKQNTNGKFITLTFSNEWIQKLINGYTNDKGQYVKGIPKELEGYDIDNAIATQATRHFLERWRKEHKKSLRHWLVTEIGHNGTENVHIHGIIWTNHTYDEIESKWGYGFIWPRKYINKKGLWQRQHTYVNESTINYMIKYIHKADEKHKEYKSIILTSPGIGANYINSYDSQLNKYKDENTLETYRTRTGHKIAMPIYWRNKIYTEEEKEKLWIQKIDKEVRYINGVKISIKNGEDQYYKTLEDARKINAKLGYGDNQTTWEQAEYEKIRRNLKIQERIKNAPRGPAGRAVNSRIL